MLRSSLIVLLLVVLSGCFGPQDEESARRHFREHRKDFDEVAAFKAPLFRKYPTCYRFRFTYTTRLLWRECDTLVSGQGFISLDDYLNPDEVNFFSTFMHDNRLEYILFYPHAVKYHFFGESTHAIIRCDTPIAAHKQFELGDGYYLVPYDSMLHS